MYETVIVNEILIKFLGTRTHTIKMQICYITSGSREFGRKRAQLLEHYVVRKPNKYC